MVDSESSDDGGGIDVDIDDDEEIYEVYDGGVHDTQMMDADQSAAAAMNPEDMY